MPATAWEVPYQTLPKLAAAIDIGTDTHKAILLTNGWVPNLESDAVYADIAAYELPTGNGYTAGGVPVTVATARSAGVARVASTNPVWTASGGSIGPFRYCAIINSPSNSILAFSRLDTSDITVPAGTALTLAISTNGLFTFGKAAEVVQGGEVVWSQSFDTGVGALVAGTDQWVVERADADCFVDYSATQKLVGAQSMRVNIANPSRGGLRRAEIVPRGMDPTYFTTGHWSTNYTMYNKFNIEYWYSAAIFLDSWANDGHAESLMQFHSMPDIDLGEPSLSPPIGFVVVNGNYEVHLRWSNVQVMTTNPPNGDNGHHGIFYDQVDSAHRAISGDLGKWVRWVFHIKWSYDGTTGFARLYKNGTEVWRRLNHANCYNDQYGCYFKAGVYRWETSSTAASRIAYYDDIRIGGPNSTYADMV